MKALVHIPKNGGTTIRKLFEPQKPIWEKHACLQEMYDNLGATVFGDIRFLAIVRNPYARLYSWWKFHKQTKQLVEYQCDFSEWMLKWCPHHWTRSPHFGGKHGLRYDAYLFAPTNQRAFLTVNGEIPLNVKIIRLEELDAKWNEVCHFFLKMKEPRRENKTASRNEWKTQYTEVTKSIARQLCQIDLDWTGYDF